MNCLIVNMNTRKQVRYSQTTENDKPIINHSLKGNINTHRHIYLTNASFSKKRASGKMVSAEMVRGAEG